MGDGPGQSEVREKASISELSVEFKSFTSVFFQLFLVSYGLGTDLSDPNAVGSLPSPGPPSLQSELLMVSGGDGAEETAVLEEG